MCLVDPIGDVYACPFAIHDEFKAGNIRTPGGFQRIWRESERFADLRRPQTGGACTSCSAFDSCRGGCMAAKFFTGLPLDGPDPECVRGHGESALRTADRAHAPRPSQDHSRKGRSVAIGMPGMSGKPAALAAPARACDESPLAGLTVPGRPS